MQNLLTLNKLVTFMTLQLKAVPFLGIWGHLAPHSLGAPLPEKNQNKKRCFY